MAKFHFHDQLEPLAGRLKLLFDMDCHLKRTTLICRLTPRMYFFVFHPVMSPFLRFQPPQSLQARFSCPHFFCVSLTTFFSAAPVPDDSSDRPMDPNLRRGGYGKVIPVHIGDRTYRLKTVHEQRIMGNEANFAVYQSPFDPRPSRLGAVLAVGSAQYDEINLETYYGPHLVRRRNKIFGFFSRCVLTFLRPQLDTIRGA